MAHYAAEDTRYLHKLAELLEQRLRELDRLEWVAEECALMEQVGFAENGGPKFLRFKGAGTLDRRQLALIIELKAGLHSIEIDRPAFDALLPKKLIYPWYTRYRQLVHLQVSLKIPTWALKFLLHVHQERQQL